MLKNKGCLISIIFCLFLLWPIIFIGNKILERIKTEQEIAAYFSDNGYEDSIKFKKTSYEMKCDCFETYVTFTDDPNHTYVFYVNGNSVWAISFNEENVSVKDAKYTPKKDSSLN